ncbi:hypothetical protein [Alysiella crassa]|uniref:Uncharacterized protein n=1 Tax=Alysiella crassa TaxID=153491 RepID=A0A376BUZ0_9NEIS|nr:hypothetical protein [Alysiella crassa]UOP06160.1 hypothetical protein LVJ80_10030 [Alysiella crassa]SSY80633.1 Uncharacterised protein [Alysiella crassa]
MAIQQDNDNGLLLVGTAYARNRRVSGSQRENVGNMVQLQISAKSETKTRTSRQKETAGNALDSITIKQASEVKVASDTFNKLTLGMALLGKSVELKKESETITDEVVEVNQKGVWLSLVHRNIDASTVSVKNDTSQPVEKEDFEINETLGWIRIKESCENVNASSAIEVSYKTKAGGGIRIEASTESDYDLEIWLDGFNQASQKNFILHIPSMVIAPTSEIDWLGDDFAKAEFGGTLVLADGYKVPYIYEEFNA